jgi:hypothetical protein
MKSNETDAYNPRNFYGGIETLKKNNAETLRLHGNMSSSI